MALTVTQIANILFKKLQGVGSTSDSRQFFEEPYLGRSAVHNSQIWQESDDIPSTAPGGIDGQVTGVVTRYIDKTLTAVAGTSNSFYHADLVDAIPFNFGDGTYNYEVKDSTSASIPFGSGDWVVDGDAGVLTFYGTVPSNMPPTISFYKYSGLKGGGGGSGTVSVVVDRFSGDGSDTTFTLSATPSSENDTWVYVSGVYQQKDTYSVSGTTLTFSEAPPTGTNNIEVVTGNVISDFASGRVTTAVDYTVAQGDTEIYCTAACVITLLDPADSNARPVKIFKTFSGAGNITITPAAGTIAGSASVYLSSQYDGAEFVPDGTSVYYLI